MEQYFHNELTSKLLSILAFVIGGIAFVIGRFILSAADKNSAQQLLKAVKKDPSLSKEISDSLDIPYSTKENFTQGHFEQLKTYLHSTHAVGNYIILHTLLVDTDQLLIFTKLSYIDFDVTVTGHSSDVNKKAHHNFVLKYDRSHGKLVALSNLYSDTTNKFQKEGFIRTIFTGT